MQLNRKKIIKVDIDGIIRNFTNSTYYTLKQNRELVPNKCPIANDWNTASGYPDIDNERFWNLIYIKYCSQVFNTRAHPYQGSLMFLQQLKKMGLDIVLITHQTPLSAKYTISWLKRYAIDYDYFIFSDSSKSKNIFLKDSILIDDKADNLLNKHDILLDRPWNINSKWKNRAFTYDEILDRVQKYYKIKNVK